jgi:phospholipid-translocating ATPase
VSLTGSVLCRWARQTNNRLANITSFASGTAVTSESVLWCKIQVGDVIRINNKQPLPADVVLLASSEDENVAYIETSQIDGETNLKLRRAITYIPHTDELSPEGTLRKLSQDKGQVVCEPPNMKINSFTGTYNVGDQVLPIDNDNVLLRGSVLRNTAWGIGVVVYTGEDTKLQVRGEREIHMLAYGLGR